MRPRRADTEPAALRRTAFAKELYIESERVAAEKRVIQAAAEAREIQVKVDNAEVRGLS
jgi:hypothetical protein